MKTDLVKEIPERNNLNIFNGLEGLTHKLFYETAHEQLVSVTLFQQKRSTYLCKCNIDTHYA